MARFERRPLVLHGLRLARLGLARSLGTLLSKADHLLGAIVAGLDDVRLGWMRWRALRSVARHVGLLQRFRRHTGLTLLHVVGAACHQRRALVAVQKIRRS